MKKIYFLPILLFFTSLLFAQPTITESITPSFGDNWDVKYIEVNSFDPGPAGANQTWNFSNLDLSNTLEINFQVVDPTTVLGNENFPTASFVWYIPGFEIYEFYEANSDSISLVGGVSVDNGEILFMTIYTNTEDGLHLPLTIGDNNPYYSEFDQYFSGSYLSSNNRNGSTFADAYGTITTPNGTYENVLRLKIEETSFGFTNTQYAWYDVNNFTPILVYDSSDDPDSPPSVYFSDPDISSSINPISQKEWNWKAWANPAENKINVELPDLENLKTIQLQVFNMEGKLISSKQISEPHQLEKLVTINLPANINCETLILKLQTDRHFSSKKILVCK